MEFVSLEVTDFIGTLTINREKALNALNRQVLLELREILRALWNDDKVRVLVLTGEGYRAFIAGADIKEMREMDHVDMHRFCSLGLEVAELLENAPFVTIAAVNGYALGGGLEMALACDFIYCTEDAKLGLPEVSLGLIPGFGGTQRLARAVGTRKAKEWIMTGKRLNAEEALECGLVNKICQPDRLIFDCWDIAKKVLEHSFLSVSQVKNVINHGIHNSLSDALQLERNACAVCFASEDRLEGMTAFTEKRKPVFA